jgi:uncharacterized membrane protein YgdD (TMEM256/DUF423 family)
MSSLSRRWIMIAALTGAVGVAFGAFAAHSLPNRLLALGYQGDDLNRRLDIFHTATRYQLVHALALGWVAMLLDRIPARSWQAAAWAFLLGMLVFSGSLYVLTVARPEYNWIGAIVPIGGLALILGWILLAAGTFMGRRSPHLSSSH